MQKCNEYFHNLSKNELVAILESSQNLLFRTDLKGNIQWITPSVEKLLGYSCHELAGTAMQNYCAGNPTEIFAKLAVSSGKIYNHRMSLRHKSGSVIWFNAAIQYIFSENKEPESIECSAYAVQSSNQTEEELQHEKEKSQVTLEAIADGVITTDSIGNIQFLNSAAEKLCGWTNAQAHGLQLNDVFRLSREYKGEKFNCSLNTCCPQYSTDSIPANLVLTRKDGATLNVEHSASPILNSAGITTGIVVVFRDVTKIRKMEKEITFRATHDSLTKVFNRFEFENRLLEILQSTGANTLCYIDLDNFKSVNDSCGHLAGDELLKDLVKIMKSAISETDIFARVGGDEFAVILRDTTVETAQAIAKRMINAVELFSFNWNGQYYQIGCSIGITAIIPGESSFEEIINRADMSCYVAKKTGGNMIRIFSPDIEENFMDSQWVTKIRSALQNNSILMYVQRGIGTGTNSRENDYNEILIRLQDNEGNIITPGDFLPAAERYRMTGEIDARVISNIFPNISPMGITAINLSYFSVSNPEFPDFILEEARKNSVDHSRVCFEISEQTAKKDLVSTIRFIEKLKPHGFLFTLDNVGKGTNSFSYLKNVPVDYFKIDDQLMKNIQNDPVDLTTVITIHEISKLLGKKTIAIVENRELLEKTVQLGFNLVQGYYINRPEPFLN